MNNTCEKTEGAKWDGNSMSQLDFMEKDTVLVLDEKDNVIGSESKRASHEFLSKQPRGVLHRAFSVFIFDESTGELLLQQRASSKITFPSVWTNTCCSHPLHGMDPPEVDSPADVADGSVMGVKHAAVRKLDHELGIPASQLPLDKFKFLTRLHYWAADTVTHGKKSPWGEHEIDYVLFFTVPSKDMLTIKHHPDEIDAIKWVTKEQLLSMMADTKLLFSPWFRIIVKKWVLSENGWWMNLKETMETDKHCDFKTISCFDPPEEHMGGGGDAGPMFGDQTEVKGDTNKKQGAYGKLKTHKESKLSQLSHLDEIWSAVTLLYIKPLKSNLDSSFVKETFNKSDLELCDEILCKVSRSFAAVIRQLPPTLLVDVLIFYLVLRALDTIEDDMNAFDSNKTKVELLLSFHKTALVNPNWSMDGVGEADEKRLLQEFPKCHSVYAALRPESKSVIADITHRMATGMAEFVDKDLGQGTKDIKEYNRYCHFVAGLVGEGLSRLFAASGLEKPSMAKELHLSDQMGLFLQKTNIIRDYLEDYVDGRAFWPQSVWSKHSESGDLGYFANPSTDEVKSKSLCCLNELVTDALNLVPDCLAYLSKLQCAEVFRFCAIPQVMAIATLDKCFHNLDVFTGVVKIRKGLSCQLINTCNDTTGVHATFYKFALSVAQKARKARSAGHIDPSFEKTIKLCDTICELTSTNYGIQKNASRLNFQIFLAAGLGVVLEKKTLVCASAGTFIASRLIRASGLSFKTSLKPSKLLMNDPPSDSEEESLKKSE
jgi:farnesyl-diphosphate farnesyltransferase/isopentenyl-diphosphate delta-isomerase type 1